MLELNKIHCGDCVDVMKDIDSDRVDCIVTDPPYQLSSPNTKDATKGFMGKSWDLCPSVEIWQECLRVLKPGAFAFVMCIPRQDCLARMICRLEDAGFNVAFSSIYWTYASGFPKAQNLSKAADKRAGVERTEFYKVPIAYPDSNCWSTPNKNSIGNDIGFETQGTAKRKDMDSKGNIIKSLPITPQAKVLEGGYSGMQLKPAVEIVIVAMKPLSEKTYLDQAISNGHGCTWLDNARIPFESKDLADTIKKRDSFKGANLKGGFRPDGALDGIINNKGRFPANVICEDNVLDDGRERNSSGRPNLVNKVYNALQPINFYGKETKMFGYPDKGSFSRYFSLDAWFAERIKHLPKEVQKTFPWLIVPKASKNEKNRGLEDMPDKKTFTQESNNIRNHDMMSMKYFCTVCGKRKGTCKCLNPIFEIKTHPGLTTTKNNHPTTKPLKLMSWLITLASREGDIVLDPFCGSGTTAIAAKMLSRQYIGIEREVDYCEIARKRVSAISVRLDEY